MKNKLWLIGKISALVLFCTGAIAMFILKLFLDKPWHDAAKDTCWVIIVVCTILTFGSVLAMLVIDLVNFFKYKFGK